MAQGPLGLWCLPMACLTARARLHAHLLEEPTLGTAAAECFSFWINLGFAKNFL